MVGSDPSDGRSRSFGAAADAYDTYRPPPPPELAELLGPLDGVVTMDLAAGTGLLTRFLAGHGARVTAVEPDGRMAAVLARRAPEVAVVRGTAEAIPVVDGSVDLLTVSSAWHWFDPARAPVEIGRVLRPGGRLAVVWNGAVYTDGWTSELGRLRATLTDLAPPGRPRHEVTLPTDAPFGPWTTEVVRWVWPRTTDEVAGFLGTFSGALVSGTRARSRFDREVRALVDAHAVDGVVELPMACRCLRATRT